MSLASWDRREEYSWLRASEEVRARKLLLCFVRVRLSFRESVLPAEVRIIITAIVFASITYNNPLQTLEMDQKSMPIEVLNFPSSVSLIEEDYPKLERQTKWLSRQALQLASFRIKYEEIRIYAQGL